MTVKTQVSDGKTDQFGEQPSGQGKRIGKPCAEDILVAVVCDEYAVSVGELFVYTAHRNGLFVTSSSLLPDCENAGNRANFGNRTTFLASRKTGNVR